MLEDKVLSSIVEQRYASWQSEFGRKILTGDSSLEALTKWVETQDTEPKTISGQQEYLENIVNSYIYR